MGKMFGKLSGDGLEDQGDRLGGGFEAMPSGIYDAVIKMAYAGESARGAMNVTVILDIGGKEMRETVYVTNAKGENFYPDKNDASKKVPLPGFTTMDDLCLLSTGEGLADQATEDKMVMVYNYDQRKEVPTSVPVLTALLGGKVKVGILRQIENKEKKDDSGNYVPDQDNEGKPKTRISNTIDKVFDAETMLTVSEYRHEVKTPEFHVAWAGRNTGKDRDRTNRSNGAGAGTSGSGRPGAAAGAEPRKKLFGNK